MSSVRFIGMWILLFALLATGCAEQAADPAPGQGGELRRVRLPMGFIPNVQYAPFYLAAEKGYFREEGLEIDFDYSTETDGVTLVGSNEVQFALVSGEQVLLARAQGLPVVYVLAWYQEYPVAVVARSDTGIRSLEDLKGRQIGLPGLFGASYIGLRALLAQAGLQESDVQLDSIGFNQVEALATNQEEAVVGYASNEPIQLAAQGIDVQVLRVADHVQLASNGLLTNEATLAQDPGLVRGMARAILRGLQDTIDNPAEAFEISKGYVEGLDQADRAVQMAVLETSIELWQGEALGYSNPQAWENMQAVLLEMGLLEQPLDLGQAFTNEFVE